MAERRGASSTSSKVRAVSGRSFIALSSRVMMPLSARLISIAGIRRARIIDRHSISSSARSSPGLEDLLDAAALPLAVRRDAQQARQRRRGVEQADRRLDLVAGADTGSG